MVVGSLKFSDGGDEKRNGRDIGWTIVGVYAYEACEVQAFDVVMYHFVHTHTHTLFQNFGFH